MKTIIDAILYFVGALTLCAAGIMLGAWALSASLEYAWRVVKRAHDFALICAVLRKLSRGRKLRSQHRRGGF